MTAFLYQRSIKATAPTGTTQASVTPAGYACQPHARRARALRSGRHCRQGAVLAAADGPGSGAVPLDRTTDPARRRPVSRCVGPEAAGRLLRARRLAGDL